MRIGFHLVRFDFEGGPAAIGPTVAAVGAAVEDAGFDNLSVMDHFFQIRSVGSPDDPMLEGYTTLGFLAAHTSTVELQLMVTGVTYRHPGLLAKIVSTLDVLSRGRAVLGLGAAWFEQEHVGLGVPYPSLKKRFELVEETLQLARQMWSPDDGPFEGKHYQLAQTLCSPQPLRPIPIMLGGSGERKTLRLVAQYADACNLFASDAVGASAIEHKLGVLREHCSAVGREYDEIRKTILFNGTPDPAGFAEHLKPFADVGVDEVHIMHFGNEPVEFVRSYAPYVPAIHAL